MEAIYTDEGRITPNGAAYRYEYTIKDHLGNARISFADLNGNNVVDVPSDILQENHYYPFGMNMNYGWMNDAGLLDSRYQYNGKELNGDFGLSLSDYLLRWYDAAIGRWSQIDLLAESDEQIGINPYHYTFNNPISYFDPWGLQGTNEYVKDNETGEYVQVGDKGGDDTDYVYGGTIFKDEEGNVKQVNFNTSEANTTVLTVERTVVYIDGGFSDFNVTDRRPGMMAATYSAPASGQAKAIQDPFTFAAGMALKLGTAGVTSTAEGVAANEARYVVYQHIENGVVRYVGITNNFARRAAEHLASKGYQIEQLMVRLTRAEARAVEQALIEIHGLGKNGGTLLNRINSISQTNPRYAELLQQGYELLRTIGY